MKNNRTTALLMLLVFLLVVAVVIIFLTGLDRNSSSGNPYENVTVTDWLRLPGVAGPCQGIGPVLGKSRDPADPGTL